MCGIIVILGDKSHKKVKNYLNKIKHRGPDDFQISSINDIDIGFVRLSINDKSTLGNQPFETDRYIAVFNGEIYNHKELKREYNISTKSDCDIEIILPLFEKIGNSIIQKLDGFFSGVIIDKKTNDIFLFKDYIGKKPLFVAVDTKKIIYIVSELKAVEKIDKLINVPKGLSKLNDNNIECIHKYSFKVINKDITKKEIKDIFIKAVDKRICIKGKFGVFISGGIDSSIIASLISKSKFASKAHYYYVADEKEKDYEYIQSIIKYLDIPKSSISKIPIPSNQEMKNLINKVVYATESKNPSIVSNGIGSYILSRQASKDEIKVVITGDGADEMFLGYETSSTLPYISDWKNKRHSYINDLYFTELRRIDLTSMSNSIEIRCPFLDKQIYEISNSLEYCDFFGNSKISLNKNILRQVFGDILPTEIANRKKVSFDVGSGIQKLMVSFCRDEKLEETQYLEKIWNQYFSKNLLLMSENKYFNSYPQFDKVIKTRGNKWKK